MTKELVNDKPTLKIDLSLDPNFDRNREKIEELGRDEVVEYLPQTPTGGVTLSQKEYGSMAFFNALANKALDTENLALAGFGDIYTDPNFVDASSLNFNVGTVLRRTSNTACTESIVVSSGSIGASQINDTLPAIADVLDGVNYGANGTELTGTLTAGGGSGEYSYAF